MNQLDFLNRLDALSRVCKYDMGEEEVALYDKVLSQLGYDQACAAISKIITTRRGFDRFPSVQDIAVIIRPEATDDDLALEVAGRIIQAIGECGYAQPQAAEKFIGEVGWEVVRRCGGWSRVCGQSPKTIGMFRAQCRDTAKAIMRLHKAGVLNKPPSFEQLESGPEVKRLTQSIKSLKEET